MTSLAQKTRSLNRFNNQSQIKLAISFVCSFLFFTSTNASVLALNASTDLANAGYFQLFWEVNADSKTYQLQESMTQDFSNVKTIYQGIDNARVISGLANGNYFYRVRELSATESGEVEWSKAVNVTVQHHNLTRAMSFFFLGLLVFLATLVAIISGSKNSSSSN